MADPPLEKIWMTMSAKFVGRAAASSVDAGFVVVIDVLRAFTTAALALEAGATEILLAADAPQAFDLATRFSDALLIGEDKGSKIEGFDIPNSPTAMLWSRSKLSDRPIILRSTKGVSAILSVTSPAPILAASYVIAEATARFLNQHDASPTYILSGYPVAIDASGLGDDDHAVATYIEEIRRGGGGSEVACTTRVRNSPSGRKLATMVGPDRYASDVDIALSRSDLPFVMRLHRQDDHARVTYVAQSM